MKALKMLALLIPVYFIISNVSLSADAQFLFVAGILWVAFTIAIVGLVYGYSKLIKKNGLVHMNGK